MNIKEELEKAAAKRAEIVNQINQLEQQKQELLQEALRLDGEVRLLQRLNTNGDKPSQ